MRLALVLASSASIALVASACGKDEPPPARLTIIATPGGKRASLDKVTMVAGGRLSVHFLGKDKTEQDIASATGDATFEIETLSSDKTIVDIHALRAGTGTIHVTSTQGETVDVTVHAEVPTTLQTHVGTLDGNIKSPWLGSRTFIDFASLGSRGVVIVGDGAAVLEAAPLGSKGQWLAGFKLDSWSTSGPTLALKMIAFDMEFEANGVDAYYERTQVNAAGKGTASVSYGSLASSVVEAGDASQFDHLTFCAVTTEDGIEGNRFLVNPGTCDQPLSLTRTEIKYLLTLPLTADGRPLLGLARTSIRASHNGDASPVSIFPNEELAEQVPEDPQLLMTLQAERVGNGTVTVDVAGKSVDIPYVVKEK